MKDIFEHIGMLYKGIHIEDPPSDYILHRFLSSDRDYAQVAKEFSLKIKDRKIIWRLWESVVPVGNRAPYFSYVAPSKPKEEKLIEELRSRERMSLEEAKDAVTIYTLKGDINTLYSRYGMET